MKSIQRTQKVAPGAIAAVDDAARDGGAVRCDVAVQRRPIVPSMTGLVKSRLSTAFHVPVRQAGRVEAVLEVEAVGSAGRRARAAQRPEPPLLAGVRDVETGDGGPGVVGEGGADGRDQRAGLQRLRRPAPVLAAAAEAVDVAPRCSEPVPGGVLVVVARSPPSRGGTNPSGSTVFVVPLMARLSNGSEAATPTAVNETDPVPAAGAGAAASGTSMVAASVAVSPPAAARHLRAIRCPLRSSLPRKAVPRPVWFRAP